MCGESVVNIVLFILLVVTFPIWFPILVALFVAMYLGLYWIFGGRLYISKNERKIGTLRWFKYTKV
jgi:hypothetical protein